LIGTPIAETNFEYRQLALETCASTNAYALSLARQGEPSNLWVTAKTQTAGKGSRGRDWTCIQGNLFTSLLLRDAAPIKKLYQLTFIASIAVSDAISEFSLSTSFPAQNPAHKWPNDVLLNGKKCSGILLESQMNGDESVVVIGIGVNCGAHPGGNLLHKATSLIDEGIKVSVDELVLAIAKHMAHHISLWESGNNFAAIRNVWLEKAYGVGEQITIQLPGKPLLEGVFSGLNDEGQLLLEMASGAVETISTADIFFNQSGEARSDV